MMDQSFLNDISALLKTNIYTLNNNYLNSPSNALNDSFINDSSFHFFANYEIDEPVVVLIYKNYYLGLIPRVGSNIIIGPVLMNISINANFKFFDEVNNPLKIKNNTDIKTLLYSMTIINNILNERQTNFESIFRKSFTNSNFSNEINEDATSILSSDVDNGTMHHSFDRVKKLEDCVSRGDLNSIYDICLENMQQGYGIVSKDAIKNVQTLAVVGITIITRASINAGIDYEIAYSLSDSFLNKIENANTIDLMSSYYIEAGIEFTKLVNEQINKKETKKENYYSRKCKDYITKNISTVTVKDLADYINVSPNYLSKIFKINEGKTITSYILEKKITFAKQMLTYLHLSEIDITYKLGFSSQSHFCYAFKKIEGVTPKKYVELYVLNNQNK